MSLSCNKKVNKYVLFSRSLLELKERQWMKEKKAL